MKKFLLSLILVPFLISCSQKAAKDYVDYVDPYMGNISHLLVPTFPTIHLPNSILRVYPERGDYTAEMVHGLPIVVTSHRGSSAFKLCPHNGQFGGPVLAYSHDQEKIRPCYYEATLLEYGIDVHFVPSHQSALYELDFTQSGSRPSIQLTTGNGKMEIAADHISGHQLLDNNTVVYVYMESETAPVEFGVLSDGHLDVNRTEVEGHEACVAARFPETEKRLTLRYGISFISVDQAKANMYREVKDKDIETLKEVARDEWNEALGAFDVEGTSEEDKIVFYTSLYRTFERPVCISEDGRYFSAFDGKVHEDEGEPFYTDDWIWDTYRATHPLRLLIEQETEEDIISSYLRMAEQMGNMWMPTFPEITGDSRRMNSNHAVATVADAIAKGLDVDAEKAFEACRKGIEEKTLAPWSAKPAGWIDQF